MKRHLSLALVAAVICTAAFAQESEPANSRRVARECGAYTVNVEAFRSPADQHDALRRNALELGAGMVQTAVVPDARRVSHRYLVITQVCDASIPRVSSQAVVIPDEHPYAWQSVPTLEWAAAILAEHSDAAASGVQSLGDGSFVVYWTRAAR